MQLDFSPPPTTTRRTHCFKSETTLRSLRKTEQTWTTKPCLPLRSDEGLTLETSALYSLRWPIYIFNLVDTTKLPCYPHRRSTTVSLETFTLYSLVCPRFKRESEGGRSFSVSTTRLWNRIPLYIRNKPSLVGFKKAIFLFF